MNKKPLHFFVFKIIGVIGIIAIITGTVLVFTGFGDFESNKFMIGGFMSTVGTMVAFIGIMIGFGPEFAKMRSRSVRYMQEENKDDLSAIANNTAEIISDAVATTTAAVQDGMRKTIFCKYCGKKIDSDAKFCSYCGKEL